MSFKFEGKVLEGVRQATTNAVSTSEPDTGVVRDIHPIPAIYDSTGPEFVSAYADQYRVSTLDAPGSTIVEYLVWAQNSSQLATVNDSTWYVTGGVGDIPQGNLIVGQFYDGVGHLIVRDTGNRSIGSIICLVIARGDVDYDDKGWVDSSNPGLGRKGNNPYLVFDVDSGHQNIISGRVSLTDSQLSLLDGGLSIERGDRVIESRYTIAPPQFWWTRNDRYEKRFGWNGENQKWEPFKGSAVKNLGYLLEDSLSFTMSPKISNLPIGAILPGDASDFDKYSMIRVGVDPSIISTPAGVGNGFDGILVQADDTIDGFDFTGANWVGVVGQSNGKLIFNPAYAKIHAGKSVWYSQKDFDKDSGGVVGSMYDALTESMYLAPLPSPTDNPLLKFGNRSYLDTVLFDTDQLLVSAGEPETGQVFVSLSTGRLVFNFNDLSVADPTNLDLFSKYYLGDDIIYDGVALNQIPQLTKSPVRLVDADGNDATDATNDLFLPDAETLPSDFSLSSWNNHYRGLGLSGILQVPDGTGALPESGKIPVRPGGDNFTDSSVGMLRTLSDGISDVIIFGSDHALVSTESYRIPDEKPKKLNGGEAFICLSKEIKSGSTYYPGSRVLLSRHDQRLLDGQYIYFLQSSFTPAVYSEQAKIYSRNRDIFRFDGTEKFYFSVDDIEYVWNSSSLTTAYPDKVYFTAAEVAEDIALITGVSVTDFNGRIVIEGNQTVEIGFGGLFKDLSGSAILGFLPGWRVKEGVPCWLPDSGISVGLSRSLVNLDKSNSICDFSNVSRIQDGLLSDSIQPNPFFFLQNNPLQDIAGIDDNIFFQLVNYVVIDGSVQVIYKNLEHYSDIIYHFDQSKFDWVSENSVHYAIEQKLDNLSLGNAGVVSGSMLGVPGIHGGLYVNDGSGVPVLQTQDDDYILPFDGEPGVATLIQRFGGRVLFGSQGEYDGTDFIVSDLYSFTGVVEPGYRLKITSGVHQGSYTIISVSDHGLVVDPAFISASTNTVNWEIFKGISQDFYNPAVVADMIYQDFNPLGDDPFKIRVLSQIGYTTDSNLNANVEGALSSNRFVQVRYGAETDNNATVTWLTKTDLGEIKNGLVITGLSDLRFTSKSFGIQVGSVLFTIDHRLVGVTTFSSDPGDSIEYLNQDTDQDVKGTLKFGTNVLSDYAKNYVSVVDLFLPSNILGDLQVEINPWDGNVNLSLSDKTRFTGEKVYLVELMDNQKDLSVQPLSGSVAFLKPLSSNVLVEMEYYEAALDGRKKTYDNQSKLITEFLPVFIRDEKAEKESSTVFLFNSEKRTVFTGIEPIIYVGAAQQNYSEKNCVIDYLDDGTGRITFTSYNITDGVDVRITYAVAESQGGERAYETSRKPVYKPPFYIEKNQNRFGVRGDRTNEFEPGQLFRFGKENFYVKGVKYYSKEDITAVYIFPETTQEVGTRAPARDILSFKTILPITPVVDPAGNVVGPDGTKNIVGTNASLGLMGILSLADHPFEPISKGQTDIVFQGDLSNLIVAGHVIEIGGVPYTVMGSKLSDDGSRTIISIASGIRKAFRSDDDGVTVRYTYRPVYPPNVRDFLGVGSFVSEEGYELVLYGLTDLNGLDLPGKTLINTIDYVFDQSSGVIHLLSPLQDALNAPQSLVLDFVKQKQLSPYVENGVVVRPTYTATYLNSIIPSEDNGLLGGSLRASYTFSNPDSFYFRVVPMTQFMSEVTDEIINEITSKQAASGALTITSGDDNWDNGRIGLNFERKHLLNKDRVARSFLDFYNTTVNSFEQVKESVSGDIIGDSDGKFKFTINRGKEWPTPGYEDDITGYLTPRNVWTDVFSAFVRATPGSPTEFVYIQPYDKMVKPYDFTLNNSVIKGSNPDIHYMEHMMDSQSMFTDNEVDDIVLTGLWGDWHKKSSYPFYYYDLRGTYQSMYENHKYSRIFPTWTNVFLRTNPGVDADFDTGYPGWYSAGRYDLAGDYKKTTWETIGQLANPVVGSIDQVKFVALTKRRPRSRIWGYYPNGIPDGVFGLLSAGIEKPCIIATPAKLKDLPINPTTGYPNTDGFLSNGGGVPDLNTGDPELSSPAFVHGDQIAWGKPDGSISSAYCGSLSDTGEISKMTGLYVDEILHGCVITFMDKNDNAVIDSNNVLYGTSAKTGQLLETVIETGDTIQSVVVDGVVDVSDPPTTDELSSIAHNSDIYRPSFDVSYTSDGHLLDMTLPSKEDPTAWAFKEMVGQNPPEPLICIDGLVEFNYDKQNPLLIPALQGQALNDSGDYTVPFIRTTNTELDRFSEGVVLADVLSVDNRLPLAWGLYPDEWLSNDGCVTTLPVINPGQENIIPANQPAALLTSVNDMPKSTELSGAPGIADLDEYDLVLVENQPGQFTYSGAMGIQSVGRIQSRDGLWDLSNDGELPAVTKIGTMIEPPRFITQTKVGSPIRYSVENAMVSVDASNGVSLLDYPSLGVIVLDLTSINIKLNNGTSATGGLNDIWSLASTNEITVRLISHEDLAITDGPVPFDPNIALGGYQTLEFLIQGANLTVTNYVAGSATISLADAKFGVSGADINTTWPLIAATGDIDNSSDHYILLESTTPILPVFQDIIWDPTLPPMTPNPNWFLPYENLIIGTDDYQKMLSNVDFAVDVDTYVSGTGESVTAYIDSDRLTFHEKLDFSLTKERGYVHPLPGTTPPISLDVKLSIYDVTVGHDTTSYMSTINRYCNGRDGTDPVPFTFLLRDGQVGDCNYSGADEGLGSLTVMGFEGYDGSIGNIPVTGQLGTFSGVPSNDRCLLDTGNYAVICDGYGSIDSKFNTLLTSTERLYCDDRISNFVVNNGSVLRIDAGDVLIVKNAKNGEGTTKAGTYLVRHVINQHDSVGHPSEYWWDSSPVSVAGNETGWCPIHFPTIESYDESTRLLVLSDPAWIKPIDATNTVSGFPINWESGFPATTSYIYILRDVDALATIDPGSSSYASALKTYQESVIRIRYTAISVVNGKCHLTLSAPTGAAQACYAGGDASNIAIPDDATLTSLLDGSYQVSGMKAWPVNVSGELYGLPDNNTVGYDNGAIAVNGFMALTFDSQRKDTNPYTFTSSGLDIVKVVAAGTVATDTLYPAIYASETNNSFVDEKTKPVYDCVVGVLIHNISSTIWQDINLPTTSIGSGLTYYQVGCVLPTTHLSLSDAGGAYGHRAVSGIYLEPSFPRSALNLANNTPKVVDSNNSLTNPSSLLDYLREIGSRDSNSYGATSNKPSEVSFEIRRIRRFHDIQNTANKLSPLRYVYEIRRGRITNYISDPVSTSQRGIVGSINFVMDFDSGRVSGTPKTSDVWNDGKKYTGTNLGGFGTLRDQTKFEYNEDVNVKPGDIFRLLDDDGSVLESIRIERVISEGVLQLAAPGLTTKPTGELIASGGMRFEIYLKNAPIPIEQSAEELFELITDKVILDTRATWGLSDSDEQGGYVKEMTGGNWDDIANHLYDDLNVDGHNEQSHFSSIGVRVGDIVVVDPAGKIPRRSQKPYVQEKGLWPIGDMGVAGRQGYLNGSTIATDQYVAGYPGSCDDNRGYYRVTEINDSDVDPNLTVSGVSTFAGDLDSDVIFDSTDVERAYAIYPTVHNSQLNPSSTSERQMDLRPTLHRDSAAKFSNDLHSMRPFSYKIIRPSSLFSDETIDLVLMIRERVLSMIELIGRGFENKNGGYWGFQKYNHIEELGSVFDPTMGAGLLSNAFILSILGRTDVSPYLNNDACLSILDRRFWVMDSNLDGLCPTTAADHKPYGMKPVGVSDHPYTAYNDTLGSKVKPLLTERIDDALDQRDRFRPVRYTWLAYRTHTLLGTLAAIKRFDSESDGRKAEQLNLLMKKYSMEKIT